MKYQKIIFNTISSLVGQQNIITIPTAFIAFTGSYQTAVLLAQLVYWQGSEDDEEGWVFKTYEEWEEEILLSKYQIGKASKILINMGVLQTKVARIQLRNGKKGDIAVHYKLNQEEFSDQLTEFLVKINSEETSLLKMKKLHYQKSSNSTCNSNTQSTAKNTAKDKSKDLSSDKSQGKGLKPNIAKGIPKKIIKPIAKPSLDPADRKANIAKQKKPKKTPKGKYQKDYNVIDEQNYIALTSIDDKVTDHSRTTQTYFDTMDNIHALFTDDCISPLKDDKNYSEDYANLTIEEVVEIFKFHRENTNKPKTINNIGKFIFSKGRDTKGYSPLITWGNKLLRNDGSLSENAQKLNKFIEKKFEKNTHELGLSNNALNNTADFLLEIEKTHEFVNTPRCKAESAMTIEFVKYLIKKRDKNVDFQMQFINGDTFRDGFLHDMVKGHTLTKKRKRGINPNKKR